MSDVGIVAVAAIGAGALVIILTVIFVGLWGKKGRKIIEE